MSKRELYRKVLASIIALTVLVGTTGFIFEEHQCTHSGTDYSVMFYSNGTPHSDSCSNMPSESCCSDETESVPDTNQLDSCTLDGQSCCKYESETISISDPVQISSTEFKFTSGDEFTYLYNFKYKAQNTGRIIFRSYYNHPLGQQTLTLISQFLT